MYFPWNYLTPIELLDENEKLPRKDCILHCWKRQLNVEGAAHCISFFSRRLTCQLSWELCLELPGRNTAYFKQAWREFLGWLSSIYSNWLRLHLQLLKEYHPLFWKTCNEFILDESRNKLLCSVSVNFCRGPLVGLQFFLEIREEADPSSSLVPFKITLWQSPMY